MPDQVRLDTPDGSDVFQSKSRLVEILYCYCLFNLNTTNQLPKRKKKVIFLSYSEDLQVQW